MTGRKEPSAPASGPGAGSSPGTVVNACPTGCPSNVVFAEDGRKWGWDDYTNPAQPWISVQTGQSDTVKASAKSGDASKMCNVTYESSNESIATVSPKSGTGDNQILTITGVAKGEITITAKCGGSSIGKLKVAVKDLLEKTVMVRLINESHYNSTDVPSATIQSYLDNIYKQAVTKLIVTKLPAKTVAFDADSSGDIDVLGPWPSSDVTRIVNAAGNKTAYDFNVFLVDKPNDGSLGWSGLNNTEQAAVVHADNSSEPDNTIAHETGHGLFGLTHSANTDTQNLMHRDAVGTSKLRKSQWDQINP